MPLTMSRPAAGVKRHVISVQEAVAAGTGATLLGMASYDQLLSGPRHTLYVHIIQPKARDDEFFSKSVSVDTKFEWCFFIGSFTARLPKEESVEPPV